MKKYYAMLLIVLCLVGCRASKETIKETETERETLTQTDSVTHRLEERAAAVRLDSVRVVDSIVYRMRHDTLFVDRWRTRERLVVRVDTIRVESVTEGRKAAQSEVIKAITSESVKESKPLLPTWLSILIGAVLAVVILEAVYLVGKWYYMKGLKEWE